uniref:Activator of Hsp90 ATPase AHSA1-like N-terminal domain-containing protein n=1 Tax=Glossina pallidipes TaxID=7398 RepID=A0A1A9ZR92_GLOPL
MAKWGEGDPRWIVEERPDATNVNNWHWTEKNATPWSKERFQQLYKDFKIAKNELECTIESVEKCSGEATVNNRKGKLIFFYEWELVLKWQGCILNGSNTSHEGKITIPNLSEENDLDEVEITVTIDKSNEESEILKQFMYNVGRDQIRQQLGVYIKELKEEYSKNLILPKKGETSVPKDETRESKVNFGYHTASADNTKVTSNGNGPVGCKLDVRTMKMVVEFQCNANDLYSALTKAEMIIAFTKAPAKVEAFKGGEFQLYGDNVHGKFEELVPEKKLLLSWRLKSWPSGHYSNVLIELEELQNCTQLKLEQSGIPAAEYETMKKNWYRYYWHSIKQTFGFGVPLADIL